MLNCKSLTNSDDLTARNITATKSIKLVCDGVTQFSASCDGAVQIAGDLTVGGTLAVSGEIVEVDMLSIEDNLFEVASGATTVQHDVGFFSGDGRAFFHDASLGSLGKWVAARDIDLTPKPGLEVGSYTLAEFEAFNVQAVGLVATNACVAPRFAADDGTESIPSYRFKDDSLTGMRRGGRTLYFSVQAANRMSLGTTQNFSYEPFIATDGVTSNTHVSCFDIHSQTINSSAGIKSQTFVSAQDMDTATFTATTGVTSDNYVSADSVNAQTINAPTFNADTIIANGITSTDHVSASFMRATSFTGRLRVPDGVISSPPIAFQSDPNSGIRPSSNGYFRFTTNATDIMEIGTTSMLSFKPLFLQQGTESDPSLTWAGDSNTGLFSEGNGNTTIVGNSDSMFWVDNGDVRVRDFSIVDRINNDRYVMSFASDKDPGLQNYQSCMNFNEIGNAPLTDNFGFTLCYNGMDTVPGLINANTFGIVSRNGAGVTAARISWRRSDLLTRLYPSGWCFGDVTDTKMYQNAADELLIDIAGTKYLDMTATESQFLHDVKTTTRFLSADGSATAPGYSFTNDDNSGMYSIGNGEVGIATNGTLRVEVQNSPAEVKLTADVVPTADDTYTCGSANFQWSGVFTRDITFDTGDPLSWHTEESKDGAPTGPWATQTATMYCERTGGQVTVTIDAVSATATSASTINFINTLPVDYRPTGDIMVPIQVVDNGVEILGTIRILTNGTINVYAGIAAGTAFTSGGNVGWLRDITVSYVKY